MCDSPRETHYYKMLKEGETPPCGWCPQNLSNDQVQKYNDLLEEYDTVVPNCGSQQCVHSASVGTPRADGFLLKRGGKKKRAAKRKAKQDAKKESKRRRLNPNNPS